MAMNEVAAAAVAAITTPSKRYKSKWDTNEFQVYRRLSIDSIRTICTRTRVLPASIYLNVQSFDKRSQYLPISMTKLWFPSVLNVSHLEHTTTQILIVKPTRTKELILIPIQCIIFRFIQCFANNYVWKIRFSNNNKK